MPSPRSKRKQKPDTVRNFALEFEAIGTHWKIEIFSALAEKSIITEQVRRRIDEFDKNYSRFRDDSWVTLVSKAAGTYTLPYDAEPMMDMYEALYRLTDGRVTPLIGRALSDAGYDAAYSFIPKLVSVTPPWDDAMEYEFPILHTTQPVLLDFGALGKGYIVDIIGNLLSNLCGGYIINAGGDILHNGLEVVEIALENPAETTEAVGIAIIENQAICGSSGNRRAWRGYNHILDPISTNSPGHIAAVWAVAKTAMLADAMTTALYFSKPDSLLKHYTFSYAIIDRQAALTCSPDFPATFFSGEKT